MSVFADVRVLDFSNHFAAAMAAMHLGDFGAEVIKVDPTARERGRDEPGYLAWNRNKRRLALDLRSPADLACRKGLIADADVAMFDAVPGVLESLGLDGVALTHAHERLIHVWAPPYGETGRWSSLPASHNILAALTGISSGQASYSGAPVHLVAPQAYYGQANCMAAAIGAALFERVRSGLGQSVVVSGSARRGAGHGRQPGSSTSQPGRSGARPSAARRTIASINAPTVSGSSSARCSKPSTCVRWR